MAYIIIKDRCTGCSACSKLCPVFAITGEKGNAYEINGKRCVECGVCSRICPQSAIENKDGEISERIKRSLWPTPDIDRESCSACGICIHWCTPGALSISIPKYQGDIDAYAVLSPSKCIGCGLCEKYCPLDAIRMVQNEKT